METDTAVLQKQAEERVRRMRERSQQLLQGGATFGEGRPPTEKPKQTDDRFLVLLLMLMLSQNGGNHPLLVLLAYLFI